jgi:hypothetical protein
MTTRANNAFSCIKADGFTTAFVAAMPSRLRQSDAALGRFWQASGG